MQQSNLKEISEKVDDFQLLQAAQEENFTESNKENTAPEGNISPVDNTLPEAS